MDTAAPNIPVDPSGGRGVYQPLPNPAGTNQPMPSTTGGYNPNESVKCSNNKTYSVPYDDVKSSGGVTGWCNRNGHYAGSSNFVGFNGKITRPSYKVDFS